MEHSNATQSHSEIQHLANQILKAEPQVRKTPEICESFQQGVNMRPWLHSYRSCYAAHGANLSVALSALRNCNGQLCGEQRRRELGVRTRTGEGKRYTNSESYAGFRFVCAANALLKESIEVGERYAKIEAGYGEHYWGRPRVETISRASSICVVMLGEVVDPHGAGANMNNDMYLNISQETFESYYKRWPAQLRKDFPTRQAFCESMAFQIVAERINIRAILVFDPQDPSNDESLQLLVQELVRTVSSSCGNRFDDIYVGLYRQKQLELEAAFQRNGPELSMDDFAGCIFNDVSYPSAKIPQLPHVDNDELACACVAMILLDTGLEVTEERVAKLMLAAGNKFGCASSGILSKVCAKHDEFKGFNFEFDVGGHVAVSAGSLISGDEAKAFSEHEHVEQEQDTEEEITFALFD